MKRGLVFFFGIITGCVLTIAAHYVIGVVYSNSADSADSADSVESVESNITIAERQIEFKEAKRFEVLQVLGDGALAKCEEKGYSRSYFTGPVVFILADGQNLFYNDQVIEIPSGKKAIQIGTYRYQTVLGEKVVPVIEFQ